MPSAYLTLSEAAEYGLATASSADIARASTLIDAYLGRPEGLVWAPDASGNPAYMTTPSAVFKFTLQSSISPGANVPVVLSGPVANLQVGDALLLDRANAEVTESVVIATTVGTGNSTQLTLQNVQFAHAATAVGEFGLMIDELISMPKNRPITRLARTPVVQIVSGTGRYAYGRRGDAENYDMEQFNLLAAVSKFGGPPVWELMQPTLQQGWDPATGQLWVPAGIMLAYYSEVKIRYIAGFPATAIPDAIKFAVAQMIIAMQSRPVGGAVKSFKAGDTSVSMFAASALDDDTKRAIGMYAVRSYV